MTTDTRQLAALLGSRICHDLISPIGAISNGVELLQMSGMPSSPELELISESVEHANARIRFFRIAYGVASPDQKVSATEIRSALADMTAGGRLKIDWQSDMDQARQEVKLLFLLIQCIESAMPWGGHITVQRNGTRWAVAGTSDRMKAMPQLWSILQNQAAHVDVSAAEVQFLLLSATLYDLRRTLQVETSETGVTAWL